MSDREKVLEGLESCAKSDPENWCYHMCEHCPYDLTAGCKHILAADALELLKEQDEMIGNLKERIRLSLISRRRTRYGMVIEKMC